MRSRFPSPLSLRTRRRRALAGFTLVEILVIVAVLGILLLTSMITFRTYYPRAQLRHTSSEIGRVIQKSRLEAVKRGVRTVVSVDNVNNELFAFADVDGRIAILAGVIETFPNELIYTPGATSELQQDDYEIVRHPLSDNVTFGSPPPAGLATVVDGLSQIPTDLSATRVLVFNPDGTVEDLGAFRITDNSDNFLEIRVMTLAGSLQTRKFLKAGDAPGAGPAGFYREGNASGNLVSKQTWVWY